MKGRIERLVFHAVAWIATALSLILGLALFQEKPSTYRGGDADEHYGEGQSFALSDEQHAKVEALMKKRGFVSKEQIEEIANEDDQKPFGEEKKNDR